MQSNPKIGSSGTITGSSKSKIGSSGTTTGSSKSNIGSSGTTTGSSGTNSLDSRAGELSKVGDDSEPISLTAYEVPPAPIASTANISTPFNALSFPCGPPSKAIVRLNRAGVKREVANSGYNSVRSVGLPRNAPQRTQRYELRLRMTRRPIA